MPCPLSECSSGLSHTECALIISSTEDQQPLDKVGHPSSAWVSGLTSVMASAAQTTAFKVIIQGVAFPCLDAALGTADDRC